MHRISKVTASGAIGKKMQVNKHAIQYGQQQYKQDEYTASLHGSFIWRQIVNGCTGVFGVINYPIRGSGIPVADRLVDRTQGGEK
jgi:hypothetical protein